MVSTKIEQTEAGIAGAMFRHIVDYLLPKGNRTHNYTHYQRGIDYFLDVTACGTRAYMTGQGKGIKANDYLVLRLDTKTERYQIESIDYYACPSDAWMALLKCLPHAQSDR